MKRPTRYPKGTWMKLTSRQTLRAIMDQRDFSLDRLARYSGKSKGFISHLTSGRKSSCSPTTAQAIAEALDVPVEILFVPSTSAGSVRNVSTGRAA